jgi:hypothetical protein
MPDGGGAQVAATAGKAFRDRWGNGGNISAQAMRRRQGRTARPSCQRRAASAASMNRRAEERVMSEAPVFTARRPRLRRIAWQGGTSAAEAGLPPPWAVQARLGFGQRRGDGI